MHAFHHESPTSITPTVRRALAILDRHEPLLPNQFARLMWPDAPGWRRHTRCGRKGVTPGGGMVLAAGGYLGRLCQAGLVTRKSQLDGSDRMRYVGYGLTRAGRASLAAQDGQAETPATARPPQQEKTENQP